MQFSSDIRPIIVPQAIPGNTLLVEVLLAAQQHSPPSKTVRSAVLVQQHCTLVPRLPPWPGLLLSAFDGV